MRLVRGTRGRGIYIGSYLSTFLGFDHSLYLLKMFFLKEISKTLGCFIGCDKLIGNKIGALHNLEQSFRVRELRRSSSLIIMLFCETELIFVAIIVNKCAQVLLICIAIECM